MKIEHIIFLAQKFNVVRLEKDQKSSSGNKNMDLLEHGIVCDFTPNTSQLAALRQTYDKVNLKNSLFTFDQAMNMDLVDKIKAQIGEYYLSYGLGGAFVRSTKKQAAKITLIEGIEPSHLDELLHRQMSRSLALKSEDIAVLAEIIANYASEFNIDIVRNNELRVQLLASFFEAQKPLENAAREDLVRLIVHTYTGSTLLIKNEKTISAIKQSEEKLSPEFLFQNRVKLSECFNRFKPIFLALKKSARANTAINTISRLSKSHHIPIGMPKSRTFIADFLSDMNYPEKEFDQFSIFEKFRILNTVTLRKSDLKMDVFQIRNGKIWYQERTSKYSPEDLQALESFVLSSISKSLEPLAKSNIFLPANIQYGLPVSEKQTIGKLPFGTNISLSDYSNKVSVGIYWQNDWGAHDLDLSIIDVSGKRTGWGNVESYTVSNIVFSGDITNAPEGAMEFMTLSKSDGFGLFVNIFSGKIGSDCKLIIGEKDKRKKQWIGKIHIDEKTTLNSRGNVLGFVNPFNEYIVYKGSMGSDNVSSPRNSAIIEQALASQWTVNELFAVLNIRFDENRPVTHDLSYDKMSYEKLVNLFEQE